MLKTRINRLVRAKKYTQAIEMVAEGAKLLLENGQGGSGTDLVMYLLEIYVEGSVKPEDDANSVLRLIQLLQVMSPAEPNLKDVITAMNNWSIENGQYKFGDPVLHNSIALKLMDAEMIYEAERYFILGTFESLTHYLKVVWSWFEQSETPLVDVGTFVMRITLNYLFIGNIKYAIDIQQQFIKLFIAKHPEVEYDLKTKALEGDDNASFNMYYFNDLPVLNMAQLLILTCQTGDAGLFQNLKEQYASVIQEYAEPLQFLGTEYFGIQTPRKVNLLQDMMSGLFN